MHSYIAFFLHKFLDLKINLINVSNDVSNKRQDKVEIKAAVEDLKVFGKPSQNIDRLDLLRLVA